MRLEGLPDAPKARTVLADILACPAAAGPRRLDGPFALYGAGKLGLMALDFCRHAGLRPQYVVDRKAAALAGDPVWREWTLVTPEDVPSAAKSAMPLVVSIATVRFQDLAAELAGQGWSQVLPLYDVTEAYRDRYPLGNGWFMGTLRSDSQAALERVLTVWSDDVSRAHHLQFIAWHRLRQDWSWDQAPVDLERRYFIPEVQAVLGRDESFLDVGAHRGEVAAAFRQAVDGQFREVVLIEPDPDNAALIQAGLADLPADVRGRHRLLTCALSDRPGRRAFFAGLGYGSQLSELGQGEARVQTLDELALAPSYVKMHLEGHELSALKGGLHTLRRHRPLVAVTAYHSDAGLWALPAWLMENLPDYRHYLRLHSWCGTGAVIYSVPGERSPTRPDPH